MQSGDTIAKTTCAEGTALSRVALTSSTTRLHLQVFRPLPAQTLVFEPAPTFLSLEILSFNWTSYWKTAIYTDHHPLSHRYQQATWKPQR